MWRVTCNACEKSENCPYISIHTLRVEGDWTYSALSFPSRLFQSTPSVWRVTESTGLCPECYKKISIHTLRVEGDERTVYIASDFVNFNPHPPCGGWRRRWQAVWAWNWNFNPHPPCGGWQPYSNISSKPTHLFQSTPSVWRVTMTVYISCCINVNFNPHPPCGGLPNVILYWLCNIRFQSTPSVWRVTSTIFPLISISKISIHTLRVEGDGILYYYSYSNN